MATGVNFGQQQYFGFDPRMIPGCYIWNDASTLSAANGTTVGTWSNSVSSVTITAGGTVSNSVLNNRTVVNFTTAQTWETSPTINLSAYSMFAVSRQTGGTNGRVLQSVTNNQLFGYWNGYKRSFWIDGNPNQLTTAVSDTNWDLMGHTRVAGGAYVFNWNGSTLFSGASSGGNNLTGLAINTGGYPTEDSTCQIAEIIVYSNVLTTSQVGQVEGYLAWKWGLSANLPVGHPYKTNPPAMRLFQPTDVTACSLWLDAADASTVSTPVTSAITQWRDKSGNGNNTTSIGAATYASNVAAFNNLNCVSNVTNLAGPITAPGTTELTMVVIGSVPALSATYWTALTLNSSVQATASANFYAAGNAFLAYYGGNPNVYGYSAGNMSLSTPITYGQPFLWIGQISGATTNTWGYGTSYGSSTVTSATYTYTGYWVGGPSPAGPAWPGNIGEIIVYGSNISASDRQKLEGYLAWKWGLLTTLPSTHPFRTLPPATPLFTPTQVSGINAWFDGADPLATGSRPTVNTTLTTWFDKSGNGRNASGGSPATFVSGGVSFNGTSHYYTMSVPYSSNYSVFLVATNTTSPQNYFFARDSLGGGREPTFIQGYIGSGIGLEWFEGSDRATIATTPVSPFLASVDHIQGTSIVGWYYGTQAFSIPQTRAYAANAWDRLGTALSSVGFYGGTMRELLFFSNVVTTPQRQQIEGYLAWKWGLQNNLPTTHPYYKFRP